MEKSRERLTWPKVRRFMLIPFRPSILKTWMAVKRFEDIPFDKLLEEGIRGVLLDVDGTLGAHQARLFPEAIINRVSLMRKSGIRVAIFTNSFENRFHQFEGVNVVTRVTPKPDREAFLTAMKNNLNLEDPKQVCMIGDNFVTDGGAIEVGMRFVYVDPIPGNENYFHRLTRYFGYLFAKFYGQVHYIKK